MTEHREMSTVARWLKVSRTPFLTASAMPVLVGTSLAWATTGQFDGAVFALAVVGMMFIHAGANLANEYFDHILGADKLNPRPSPLFGGSGSIQDGLVSAKSVRLAAVLCLAVGSAMGIAIVVLAHKPLVLLVGFVGIVGAWCYTAPPLKLAYRTFGEVTIGLLFGILPVWTSYYIQTGSLDFVPLMPALIAAILIFEVILANEFPDAPTDAAAGKHTVVVRFGPKTSLMIYVYAIIAALIIAAIAGVYLQPQHKLAWGLFVFCITPCFFVCVDAIEKSRDTQTALPIRVNVVTIIMQAVGPLALTLGFLLHTWHR
jgi:1,4-dihydroxy-2-naphthoate polyprenyltransferase